MNGDERGPVGDDGMTDTERAALLAEWGRTYAAHPTPEEIAALRARYQAERSMDELAAVTQEDGLYDPPPLCGCGRHQPCRHCDEDDALNEAMEEGRPVFFVPGSPPFAGTQAKDPQ